MTRLWAELIDNGLLSDPEATANVHGILNIVQCSLVLVGNTDFSTVEVQNLASD